MNRLFVANKPANISSNRFLGQIKRKYGVRKAGFSGTLDPFAQGVLVVAFGQYPKLFRFLDKRKKSYRATLWIGALSASLDSENITKVEEIMPFATTSLDIIFANLLGEIEYLPPKFSAKKVAGVRAYKLARNEIDFELHKIKSTIFELKICHYMHPFLTFEITISEGGYVRSIGELIAQKLGVNGTLCFLERLSEGSFVYENEKALNPLKYLGLQSNEYLGDLDDIALGKKLLVGDFAKSDDGIYSLVYGDELSVLQIKDQEVRYELNKVKLC